MSQSRKRGQRPPADATTTEAGTVVTLAQTIQYRPTVDGKPAEQLVTLYAGREYPVGTGPEEVDPQWLAKQPLLDVTHDANQTGIAKRRKILEEIQKRQKEAEEKGRQKAAAVGRYQRPNVGIL